MVEHLALFFLSLAYVYSLCNIGTWHIQIFMVVRTDSRKWPFLNAQHMQIFGFSPKHKKGSMTALEENKNATENPAFPRSNFSAL